MVRLHRFQENVFQRIALEIQAANLHLMSGRDLYEIAAAHEVQIRRLNFKRDSLEDIFLKAMETNHGSV